MCVTLQISIHYSSGWRHAKTHIMELDWLWEEVCVCVRKKRRNKKKEKCTWTSAYMCLYRPCRHILKWWFSHSGEINAAGCCPLCWIKKTSSCLQWCVCISWATVCAILWYIYVRRRFLHYPCVLSSMQHFYHAGAPFSSPTLGCSHHTGGDFILNEMRRGSISLNLSSAHPPAHWAPTTIDNKKSQHTLIYILYILHTQRHTTSPH